MLERIIEIFKRKNNGGVINSYSSKNLTQTTSTRCLHDGYRKREADRIARENESMANRMIHQFTEVNSENLLLKSQILRKMLQNI